MWCSDLVLLSEHTYLCCGLISLWVLLRSKQRIAQCLPAWFLWILSLVIRACYFWNTRYFHAYLIHTSLNILVTNFCSEWGVNSLMGFFLFSAFNLKGQQKQDTNTLWMSLFHACFRVIPWGGWCCCHFATSAVTRVLVKLGKDLYF